MAPQLKIATSFGCFKITNREFKLVFLQYFWLQARMVARYDRFSASMSSYKFRMAIFKRAQARLEGVTSTTSSQKRQKMTENTQVNPTEVDLGVENAYFNDNSNDNHLIEAVNQTKTDLGDEVMEGSLDNYCYFYDDDEHYYQESQHNLTSAVKDELNMDFAGSDGCSPSGKKSHSIDYNSSDDEYEGDDFKYRDSYCCDPDFQSRLKCSLQLIYPIFYSPDSFWNTHYPSKRPDEKQSTFFAPRTVKKTGFSDICTTLNLTKGGQKMILDWFNLAVGADTEIDI